jgi:hypothetical protein
MPESQALGQKAVTNGLEVAGILRWRLLSNNNWREAIRTGCRGDAEDGSWMEMAEK